MSSLKVQSLSDAQQGFCFLDVLSDTYAWLKDKNGEFIYANQLFLQLLGLSSVQQLQGKDDYDIAPARMADEFCKDDERVLRGRVIIDRLELIPNRNKATSWFLTSKWPVYNFEDQIIGTFGTSRYLNETLSTITPFRELNESIEYIQRHFSEPMSVEQLARATHLSISALERRFKKHLSITPRQYIIEFRLEQARYLLMETNKSIATIALETGFSDHSHFTKAYKKCFQVIPSHDRNRQKTVRKAINNTI